MAGNKTTTDFDLDAALEEKFQEVQQDLNHFREATKEDIVEKHPFPTAPESSPQSEEIPELEEEPEEFQPQFHIGEEDFSEPDSEKPTESAEDTKKRRKRHKFRRQMVITNRIGAVVRVFAIGTVLFGTSIFLLVGARPTESAEENRTLATFPSFSLSGLKDGTYAEELMHYYEDTVPGRSTFKRLISKLESYSGLQGEDQVTFYGTVQPIQAEEAESETPVVTTTLPAVASAEKATTETTATTAPPEKDADPIEIGDGIVLADKRAISVYGGSFSRGESYAASLNAFQAELGESVNVYSLVAPTAVSFYLPDSYSGYTGSEWDNIQHINENLVDVKPVDAYTILSQHVGEEIYARTDHHWLPLGAYYAAQAFADVAEIPFADLDTDYTKTTLSGYLGSMYTFTKSAVLQENPEDFTYYTPKNHYTTTYYDTDFTNAREGNLLITLDNVEPVSWYLVFMGGDEKITHVNTDVQNGRTLCIIKDSYGNALVPYLTQSFEDIYVIDMRYFDLNAVTFLKEIGATDVLFAMNTFSATGSNSECLETIRTQ